MAEMRTAMAGDDSRVTRSTEEEAEVLPLFQCAAWSKTTDGAAAPRLFLQQLQ